LRNAIPISALSRYSNTRHTLFLRRTHADGYTARV
jgi:hypothetical protein